MDAWTDIRRKARQCHEDALRIAGGDRRANALVEAGLKPGDLELRMFEPGTRFGHGVYGVLERSFGLVNVAKHQSPEDQAVVIAHEIGHFHLHQDLTNEVTVRSCGLGGDAIESGVGKVEGYSPRERKEVQAEVFASEFLCPADWIREEYIIRGRRLNEIATELGLPKNLVMNQLICALLLPPLGPQKAEPPGTQHVLDESQKAAASWSKSALLVDAGPGTGKTRTLIARIKFLLENGSPPGSILALTFSKKASNEMKERLSVMDAPASIQMWTGTFHAFGLELVTKWPSGVGRTSDFRVLDETGTLSLLEENLSKLPLRHYQNLYNPSLNLVDILRAISRCKDELISPEVYLAEAKAALVTARTEDEILDAERAIEVGEVYQIYEDALRESNSVDFGDLVSMATQLVEHNPDVKQYISWFKHVLVDEYQDVNFASARLLRAICATGADVWVVADQRQSIYRFRGAQPTNVERFADEFKGTKHSLSKNYRSFGPVVRTFEQFSKSMGIRGEMAGSWTATRTSGGEVTLAVTPNLSAEAEAIRDKIEEFRVRGVPYSEQVILARTHLMLARLTRILEQLGVPLLYLGDLFERDEIRNLLSLVAIDAEFGGIGLIRVAALPAYQATRADALAVIQWAHEQKIGIFNALTRTPEIGGLSQNGRIGLAKLGTEIEGLANASPWTLLTTWLFERSDFLQPLLIANDVLSQQKLVAIYHLLKVCGEQVAIGDPSRKRFLDRIRRIESLNQDSSYRAVAAEAGDLDAVRVMTIHGTKGLEFRAVHFPALATRYMPTNRQGNRCLPPPSIPHLIMQSGDHDAEEECLFFVGLSRARDFLSLSRAERYTAQNASPSRFLTAIQSTVRTVRSPGSGTTYSDNIVQIPQPAREHYTERELRLYLKCAARYRYEIIEGLRGPRTESAYLNFHNCVYATIGWIEQEKKRGNTVSVASALARLAEQWQDSGPVNHAFEAYYRKAAEDMVRRMVQAISGETGHLDREEWLIPVGTRQVAITPDRVLLAQNGDVHVQRIRTGKRSKSEPDDPIYALLRLGAAARYAGNRVIVETFYLSTGERVPTSSRNDTKHLQTYASAISDIERGCFEPTSDTRNCPTCQCYFMCRG